MRCMAMRLQEAPTPPADEVERRFRSVLQSYDDAEALWCAPGCDPRRLGDRVCDEACRNGTKRAWRTLCACMRIVSTKLPQSRAISTTVTALGVLMGLGATRMNVLLATTLVLATTCATMSASLAALGWELATASVKTDACSQRCQRTTLHVWPGGEPHDVLPPSQCFEDGGDCAKYPPERCDAQCAPQRQGDGICDEHCNTPTCRHDLNDCDTSVRTQRHLLVERLLIQL